MEGVLSSDFFPFDELTYPEVAALPRETSLVLPLGWGYDFEALPARLGASTQIGILPVLPFGWRGSSLETPRPVFR